VVMQIPSLASIYLYALMKTEPALCEALSSRLQAATNRQEIRFLVALYMTALRVALEEWLEQETQGDLVSLLRGYLDDFSSLSHQT
jgi:MftR C-terminal domain